MAENTIKDLVEISREMFNADNTETAKAFDFAVEKLKAAGIEVVQDKDEFTSILNSEKNIQKMVEDLSDIEKLANQLSEEKEKTQELNEKVQNLEDVKKKNELSKRQISIDFIHSIDYLIPYTTENRHHLYNKYLDNGIIVGKTEHENKNVYLVKTHTELLLAIKRQSWSDEPFIKTTLDTPESSGQYKTIFLSNDEIIKNLKDLLQNKIVKEQQIQNKNFQKIEKLDNELKSEKSDDIIESFKAISNVLKTGDEDIVKNPTLDDVEIRFGAKNKGLAHIIIRRMEERTHRSQNSLSIEDAQKEVAMILTYVREAVIKSEAKITPRGNFNAELKGIKAVIDKDENGRYVLTGFDNKQKKEESAETINAGIAKYGYAPEFLEMYAQVGAVYSSYQNISQNQNKSTIQEMTLSDGTVYGFTHEGKIYLNPDVLSSNTPIHEYTHLWDKYTENTNPELWEKGKEAFKQTSLWNEVISDPNYADIRDDENLVLSECHARICGNIAEKVLERIAAENGEIAKVAVIDWDKEVWTYIAENYSHDITKFASVAEFMTMPMKDFWNEKEINIEQVKNFEFEKAIDSVFMKETIKNHESMDEWSSAVAWATINGTRIGAEYNLSYDGDDDYTNRSAIYLLTEEKNGDIKTDYDTFIHYEIDFDDERWEYKLEEAMKNALIEFSNEIKPEISVEQDMTDVYRLEVEKLAQQNLTLKKENKVLTEHNKELTKKEALQTNLLEDYKRSEIELARENAVLQDKVNGLEYQNKQMKSNLEYVSAFSVEKLQSVAKNMLEHGDKTLGDRFGRLYLEEQKLDQRKLDDVERIVDEAKKNESSRKNDGGYSSY